MKKTKYIVRESDNFEYLVEHKVTKKGNTFTLFHEDIKLLTLFEDEDCNVRIDSESYKELAHLHELGDMYTLIRVMDKVKDNYFAPISIYKKI